MMKEIDEDKAILCVCGCFEQTFFVLRAGFELVCTNCGIKTGISLVRKPIYSKINNLCFVLVGAVATLSIAMIFVTIVNALK